MLVTSKPALYLTNHRNIFMHTMPALVSVLHIAYHYLHLQSNFLAILICVHTHSPSLPLRTACMSIPHAVEPRAHPGISATPHPSRAAKSFSQPRTPEEPQSGFLNPAPEVAFLSPATEPSSQRYTHHGPRAQRRHHRPQTQ